MSSELVKNKRIVIIGAGNLATNLGKAFLKNGFTILQVYSRTIKSAKKLAEQLQSSYINNVKEIESKADIYFIAVKDDAIISILQEIEWQDKLIVHCSGSTPMSVLADFSKNYGVFYPLQTFSKDREADFQSIPIFIEANNPTNENILNLIGMQLSNTVKKVNSEQRLSLHVAAVFACNFVNYLYTVSSNILENNNIDFKHVQPLIKETANKIQSMHPAKAQTGPAVRYDKKIIDKHIDYLKEHADYQEVYRLLSQKIYEMSN